jgi:hypothetical protein
MENLLNPLNLQTATEQPKKRKSAANDGIIIMVRGDQETPCEPNNVAAMQACGWNPKN